MVETYESAVKRRQRETPEDEEFKEGLVNYAEETGVEFDGETLQEKFEELFDITVVPPDFLNKSERDRDFARRRQPDLPGFDVDIGDIETILQSGNQIEILGAIGRILLGIFATMTDVAEDVAPGSRITVSGTNAISQANLAEPVVPESDKQLIPTRWLFIKADDNNSDEIAIGDDDVAPTSGFVLAPGESIYLHIDIREEEYYMASDSAGEQVQLLGGF